jgi:hypothetical protein
MVAAGVLGGGSIVLTACGGGGGGDGDGDGDGDGGGGGEDGESRATAIPITPGTWEVIVTAEAAYPWVWCSIPCTGSLSEVIIDVTDAAPAEGMALHVFQSLDDETPDQDFDPCPAGSKITIDADCFAAEGQAAYCQFELTDPDTGATLSFTLWDGEDAGWDNAWNDAWNDAWSNAGWQDHWSDWYNAPWGNWMQSW